MSFTEKTIVCSDCGANFTFSAEEQEFFATKGYTNDPKRCTTCREARKSARFGNGGSGAYSSKAQRQMHPAVCSQCGKETEVPFEPREGRPVYCSDCYSRVKPAR
ncbi:MAG: zinc-ribbon domain containing protein [Chloroflexota bacterium]|nr:zinc-ribbon domain containing protein [Chloroflexota bacterium]